MDTKITESTSSAIELIKKGELVAFPTETVYGLGASIFNLSAIEKIFIAKGRPLDNPLISHVASIAQALELIKKPSPHFTRLAEMFWPGPLALVLERNPLVPGASSAGLSSISIRMPSHPMALEIIKGVGSPLAAPSANISGRPSPTTAQDVYEDLRGKIPLIVDGGPCSIGIESTVLSLLGEVPILLRPGSIRREALEEALLCKIGDAPKKGPILSPGMKYRHYAPNARVHLIFNKKELKGPYILSKEKIEGTTFRSLSVQNLYSSLREADRLKVDDIEIYCDEEIQSNLAIMDRLLRASGKIV